MNKKNRNIISFNLAFRSIFIALFLMITSVSMSSQNSLSITRVAIDKNNFDPGRGETVTLRYRISQPATVLISFTGPDGYVVRKIKQVKTRPGEQLFRWDGKNNQGDLVAPEAYIYKLIAKRSTGEEAVYDQSNETGGETIYPQKLQLDASSGNIIYQLKKPGRVRLIMSNEVSHWPVQTLLDWVPRGKGRHTEEWNGRSTNQIVHTLTKKNMIPIMYAYSLPRNTVIVKDKRGKTKYRGRLSRDKKPLSVPLVDPAMLSRTVGEKPVHFHASHPWQRCYNPEIVANLPEGIRKMKGIPVIERQIPLSFDISKQQPPGRARPIGRVSVFIFVDGKMVERLLSGYAPYQWIIDPSILSSGEHVITGLFTWRDDHFGIAHKKIWVEEYSNSTQKKSALKQGNHTVNNGD